MSAGPDAFLLFHDNVLAGADQVVSVTSEAAPRTERATANTTNQGGTWPLAFLLATATEYAFDVRQSRAGSPGVSKFGEWIWRPSGGTQWYGVNDLRLLRTPHDPLTSVVGDYKSPLALFSTAYHRVLLFLWSSGTTWAIRYRDASASPISWTSATVEWTRADDSQALAGWEDRDGSLHLLVRWTTDDSYLDFDHYLSEDGGLTWTRIGRNLLENALGYYSRPTGISRLMARRSGDFVRFCFVNESSACKTLVSKDRGASWEVLDDLSPTNNSQTYDPFAFDFASVEDEAGSFILHMKTAAAVVTRYLGTGSEDWVSLGTLSSQTNTKRIAMATGPDRLYAFYFQDDGSVFTGIHAYHQRKEEVLTSFIDAGTWPAFNNSAFFVPFRPQFLSLGGPLLLWHGLLALSGPIIQNHSACHGFLDWDARSLFDVGWSAANTGELWTQYWSTCFGDPMLNPSSPYILIASGVSTDWSSSRERLTDTSTATQRYRWQYNNVGVETWAGVQGSTFNFTCQVNTCAGLADDRVGFRVVAANQISSATLTVDFSCRLDSTGAGRVEDNAAGATLTEFSGGFHQNPTEFRATVVQSGATVYLDLAWKSLAGLTWNSTGSMTLAGTSTATMQIYRWGHLSTGGDTRDSEWRNAGHRAQNTFAQRDFSNPTILRGRPLSPSPAGIRDGVWVGWTGSGGYEGDQWALSSGHAYPVENVFTSPLSSPWRSTTTSAQTLDFSTGSALGRFAHDGVALLNTVTRTAYVYYDASGTFSPPSAVHTLNADLGLAGVQTVSGSSLRLTDATSTFAAQSLVGKYLYVVNGAAAGNTLRVERMAGDPSTGIRLTLATSTDLATLGLTAADTVALFDTQMLKKYDSRENHRFFRVAFPPTGSGETYHQLGRLVAGPVRTLDALLKWERSLGRVAQTRVATFDDGVSFRTARAPVLRTFQGSVQGSISGEVRNLAGELAELTDLDARPFVFCLDDEALPSSAYYVRFQGSWEERVKVYRSRSVGWEAIPEVTFSLEEVRG